MAVINPLYEPSPLLRLQVPESRIILSTKTKLFFSLLQIPGERISSAPTLSETVWVYIPSLELWVCLFSHRGGKWLFWCFHTQLGNASPRNPTGAGLCFQAQFNGNILSFFLVSPHQPQEPSALSSPRTGHLWVFLGYFFVVFPSNLPQNNYLRLKCPSKSHCCLS